MDFDLARSKLSQDNPADVEPSRASPGQFQAERARAIV